MALNQMWYPWLLAGGACVASVWWLFKKLQKPIHEILPENGRSLGFQEVFMFKLNKLGMITLSNALILSTKVKLEEKHIEQVLGKLTEIHPLLSMGVKDINGELWYVPLKYPELPYTLSNNTEWKTVLEEELLIPYKAEDFLWRAVFCPRIKYNETEGYQSAVIFSFNHCIADGASYMRLFNTFLTLLADSLEGKESVINRLPLIEPIRLSDLNMTFSDKITAFMVKQVVKLIGMGFLWKKNMIIERFGSEMDRDETVRKRTCVIPTEYSTELTSKLLQGCKTRKITVHGAVMAAALMAVAKFWEESEEKNLKFNTTTTVDLRRMLPGNIAPENLGVFLTGIPLFEDVSISDRGKEAFWNLAEKCTKDIHRMIDKGEHFKMMKMFQAIAKLDNLFKEPEGHGRTDTILVFTNLGNCSYLNRSDASPVKLLARFGASAEQKQGHIFANNLATFEGKLFWNVVYYSNVTSKAMAEQYAENISKILEKSL